MGKSRKAARKKPEYPLGSAITLGKRIGYVSCFENSPRTRLFLKGLHKTIEAWMLDHPGERVPSTRIAKRFGCTKTQVVQIARLKIERAHNLPKRKKGGPNSALSPETIKIISDAKKTAQKTGQPIKAWDLMKKIARDRGEVVVLGTIRKRINTLPGPKVRMQAQNIPELDRKTPAEIEELLKREGIEVTTVRRKIPMWEDIEKQ